MAVERLEAMLRQLPTQTYRSEAQVARQQFSTPRMLALFEFGGDLRSMLAQGRMAGANAAAFAAQVYQRLTEQT